MLDRVEEKIVIDFDATKVDRRVSDWLKDVAGRIGLDNLSPAPYGGFRDVAAHIGDKLINCFSALVDVKKREGN